MDSEVHLGACLKASLGIGLARRVGSSLDEEGFQIVVFGVVLESQFHPVKVFEGWAETAQDSVEQ